MTFLFLHMLFSIVCILHLCGSICAAMATWWLMLIPLILKGCDELEEAELVEPLSLPTWSWWVSRANRITDYLPIITFAKIRCGYSQPVLKERVKILG